MKLAPTFFLALGTVVTTATAGGLGDRLLRAYRVYDEMPLTVDAALSSGYVSAGACDPSRGTPYTLSGDYDSKTSPSVLFYACSGQVSGVAVSVHGGGMQQELIDRNLWEVVGEDHHMVSVTFRSGDLCSGACSPDDGAPVGRQLVVNHHLNDPFVYSLPLNESQAEGQGWVRGSCFDGMGNHYFKDFGGEFGEMSWIASKMLPVVVMYNLEGAIHSFFFTTTIKQQGAIPFVEANEWEPVALETANMCQNWCDDGCGWTETDVWSTQHWFFNDVEEAKVTCDASLECFIPGLGCCPASA